MPTMFDEILEKGLGHESGCLVVKSDLLRNPPTEGPEHAATCTCGADKRRKYLERLKEPTEGMIQAQYQAISSGKSIPDVFKDGLKAAEEDL